MNIISTIKAQTTDCKACVASVTVVYAPLALMLAMAVIAF